MRAVANDLDYLAARLHGRRSRLAEAERLDELCRLRSIPELASALYPEKEFQAAVDLQRQWVQDLIGELSELPAYLTGAGARLVSWMLARFQVENLKVLLRGFVTRTPLDVLQRHLVSLPRDLALDTQALATANSLAEFVRLLPEGPLRESIEEAAANRAEQPKLFFLEAALDRGYFRELLARAERVSGEDKEVIQAMVVQEVDLFHLMLVARGKFHYGLTPASLLPLHLGGTRISRARFAAMLGDPDLRTAAGRAVGRAVDALPPEPKGTNEPIVVGRAVLSPPRRGEDTAPYQDRPLATIDPAMLEALAWARFLRLANAAFRRSHIGLGAVVGYVGLRRLEVANLITLSEGIRTGLAAEALRARLIPRSDIARSG